VGWWIGMSELRKSSRADRRRTTDRDAAGGERRQPTPLIVTIYSQQVGDEAVLFVRDPLIADNCVAAKDSLLAHAQRYATPTVVVDLENATYVDTTGLAVLFDVKKQITERGRSFFLQNPSRSVLRMLNITRMNRIFSIRYSTDDQERIPLPDTDGRQSPA
jgi:anti-sigma B factor antagonist